MLLIVPVGGRRGSNYSWLEVNTVREGNKERRVAVVRTG